MLLGHVKRYYITMSSCSVASPIVPPDGQHSLRSSRLPSRKSTATGVYGPPFVPSFTIHVYRIADQVNLVTEIAQTSNRPTVVRSVYPSTNPSTKWDLDAMRANSSRDRIVDRPEAPKELGRPGLRAYARPPTCTSISDHVTYGSSI